MPNEFGRNLRVSKEIKRELAPLVQRLANESHAGIVTVTGVDVAPDLRHAKVYVSCLGKPSAEVIEILNRAAGHLRHHLAQQLRMKVLPRIHFSHDESLERGARISALLHSLDPGKPAPGDTDVSDEAGS
jgi:ribosome-binding factor A